MTRRRRTLLRADPARRAGASAGGCARRGHQAHLVGGGVRDMLLGRPPADFDLATDARPDAVLELFGSTFAIPTGPQARDGHRADARPRRAVSR